MAKLESSTLGGRLACFGPSLASRDVGALGRLGPCAPPSDAFEQPQVFGGNRAILTPYPIGKTGRLWYT